MNLKQDKMTVTEYVTKFTKLARFAPTIVPTDDVRKRKFMLGLRVEVAKQIDGGSHGPRSYTDAVQYALRNESWDRIEPKTAPNKEEMALVPIERSMPNGVKRSYEAPAEGSHADQCNSSVPKVHKETPGRMPLRARLFYLRTGGTLREGLPHTNE